MKDPANSDPVHRLALQLSHKEMRSGASIAEALGYSRTAVWKHVESLRKRGIEVDAVAGQGYRLREPLEFLDESSVHQHLDTRSRSLLKQLKILGTVSSTNDWLQSLDRESQHACALLAEHQSSGKGRRGRSWVSPFARNLYLSLGWRFDLAVADLACLPLVVAIAACEALDACEVPGVRIKWPNDLLLNGAKLGGCLVEVHGDAAGPCLAIVGIGVNVRMNRGLAGEIDQPWTDAASVNPEISRNRLAGHLLNCLLRNISVFAESGFDPFVNAWKDRDAVAGSQVVVSQAGRWHEGIAIGISREGGLMLQSPTGVAEYRAGEISIRQKDL